MPAAGGGTPIRGMLECRWTLESPAGRNCDFSGETTAPQAVSRSLEQQL